MYDNYTYAKEITQFKSFVLVNLCNFFFLHLKNLYFLYLEMLVFLNLSDLTGFTLRPSEDNPLSCATPSNNKRVSCFC